MIFITHRQLFFILLGILTLVALGALLFKTPQFSIEFTGGSLVEVSYTEARPTLEQVKEELSVLPTGEMSVRESGTNGIVLRAPTLTPEEHTAVLAVLSQNGARELTELRFTSIGPSLGTELATKAWWALLAVIGTIMLYIAWAFRKVSKPVSSWIYGFIVVLILAHDIIVPAGFYAILSIFTGAQIDTLFVVALLAILGYSVNDTIVIFDRVREHLKNNERDNILEPFEKTIGKSIMETLGRSINTSLTVVLALLALVFFGSEATFNFALVLLVGVIVGTYSSIIVAAPLLIPFSKVFKPKKKQA